MIPFVDLKAQLQSIRPEVDEAVKRVLDSCQFTLGPEVSAFEREFAAFSQSQHAIGVNSGTSALHLALLAAGIGPGDEVITTPFTFIATLSAIDYVGARPVLVDIEPDNFLIDPARIEVAITPRTRAILPVHLYGQMADMDAIMGIAKRHGLIVIEDAAQAHGALHKGRPAGSIGDLGCFSFYPGKNLGAYGEGGLVTTRHDGYAQTLLMLRDWGARQKYHHEIKGFNFRLDSLQAAILRVKLAHLPDWTKARQDAAAYYSARLTDCELGLPHTMPDRSHVFHIYAVRTQNRAQLITHLHAKQIQTGIHYPVPVHLQPAFAPLGYQAGDFPHAEKAAHEVLSLPLFAELTRAQQDEVHAALQEFCPQITNRRCA